MEKRRMDNMDTEMNKGCSTCKYDDLTTYSEPCIYCKVIMDKWEPMEGKKMEKGKFTKDMLEDSMVVETRNGVRYLVCGCKLMSMDNLIHLSRYDGDMKHIGCGGLWPRDRQFDIVKVFDKIDCLSERIEHSSCLNILWERHEIKEVTLKEIAEKFGVDEVKVIDAQGE